MQFEEFKDMLKSGDLEQIRPHLAFEMMPADSPIARILPFKICMQYLSYGHHLMIMPEALQKSHLQENSVVILELVAEKQFNWFKMKWRRKH